MYRLQYGMVDDADDSFIPMMYIYIYICIYTHIYIHIYTYVYVQTAVWNG